jgi:hypothetical protein
MLPSGAASGGTDCAAPMGGAVRTAGCGLASLGLLLGKNVCGGSSESFEGRKRGQATMHAATASSTAHCQPRLMDEHMPRAPRRNTVPARRLIARSSSSAEPPPTPSSYTKDHPALAAHDSRNSDDKEYDDGVTIGRGHLHLPLARARHRHVNRLPFRARLACERTRDPCHSRSIRSFSGSTFARVAGVC